MDAAQTHDARFREAMRLHQTGAVEQAEAIYRNVLRDAPGHAGAWHLLGVVLQSRGDFPAALKHIERAIALVGSKAVYWNNYGVVLKEVGRLEEAKGAFERAVRLRDRYTDAWSNLGAVQCELGEFEDSERSLRYALQLAPGHADALCHLAHLSREKGDFAEAVRICRDAACVAPERAELYEIESAALHALGRSDEAVAACQRAVARQPASPGAHLNLAAAYGETDEVELAQQSFEQAAALRPDREIWRLRRLSVCPTVFQSAQEITEFRSRMESQLDEALAAPPSFDWRRALQDGFVPPFQLSHHGVGNRGLKEKFARLFAPHFPTRPAKVSKHARLRIAFTCTQSHQGGFVRGFGRILERLDRRQFEVVGAVSRGIVPYCQKRVRSDAIKWLGLPHDLERALQVFEQIEADIVVHWTPGTDAMNYFLPFLPLAPIQCIGFGMHGTGAFRFCRSYAAAVNGVANALFSRTFQRCDL